MLGFEQAAERRAENLRDVVTLPDGLQYKGLTEGRGPKPTASDLVTLNYRATRINGEEFYSSYKRGHPVTIRPNQLIKGFSQAVQMMPAGSKWQLFIPADLACGASNIAPGNALIFEVELLSIGERKK